MPLCVCTPALVTASLMAVAVAAGNSDQSSAMAPVTNGAAALVPPNVSDLPSGPRLVMFSPGASRPRLPIELPRLEWLVGLPCPSHPATGIGQEWRERAEPPTSP